MAFELTASRVVAPYLGNTIYIWTSIIGVILGALALGYTFGGYLADKRQQLTDIAGLLLFAAVAVMLLYINQADILRNVSLLPIADQWQALLASLCLFSLPTLLLGMVPPYAVRLQLTSLETSGRHVARMNAAETIGSLVGTFLTGFVLFSYVGTNRILIGLAGLLLVMSLALALKRFWRWHGLAGLLLICLAVAPLGASPAAVADIDTAYARYTVRRYDYNNQPAIGLFTSLRDVQSSTYERQPKRLAAPYVQAFAAIAQAYPTTQRSLIIGGGAFSFPQYLAAATPTASIDTIEIDGQLPAISRNYFGFRQPANLQIHRQDGRQFINQTPNRYDSIFVDAYASQTPPFQLLTSQAVERLHDRLQPGGVVAVNLLSSPAGPGSAYVAAISQTYQRHFRHVQLYQINPDVPSAARQSILLLAADQPFDTTALERGAAQHTDYGSIGQPFSIANMHRAPLFTDDYAPVERLLESKI